MTDSIMASVAGEAALTAEGSQPKPTKAEGAAKQFEALLIHQMLKTARETGSTGMGDEDDDSDAEPMRDIADQQFSQMLAKGGGLGLASMLVKGLNQGEQNANQQRTAAQ